MDFNFIDYDGESVYIGPTPAVLGFCGFSCREEVMAAAHRHSTGIPYMNMEDVVAYFKKIYD